MKTLPYMNVLVACVLIASTLSATPLAPAQGVRAVSPLQNILNVFASQDAASWPSFDTVPGVRWRDAKPLANPDATSIDESLYRSGNLLLSGFGEVDVPDGSVGAEAGIRKDNEGDVGVTLNGNASSVQSIALLKFYPSENYAHIIQQQLSAGATVQPISGQCALDYGTTAANTQKNTFYQVAFGAVVPIYIEAYVDEDGGNLGPGSTTFVLYRNEPIQRIAAMRCKTH